METKDVIAAGRLRLGLTHQAFADKVGVSRGAVQQWEKGSTAPTRKHQPLIAKLLGITVADRAALRHHHHRPVYQRRRKKPCSGFSPFKNNV